MSACTFFGHRDCPDTVKPALREAIEKLILECGVDTFYVGNQGQFDACVRSTLRQLSKEYPHIRYAVVLAYMPGKQTGHDDFSDTMLPEGIESVHLRYAISWRNNWMLKQSDHVICYIRQQWGGAAQYVKRALHEEKTVINLCDSSAKTVI